MLHRRQSLSPDRLAAMELQDMVCVSVRLNG